jgi:hypothetical protein
MSRFSPWGVADRKIVACLKPPVKAAWITDYARSAGVKVIAVSYADYDRVSQRSLSA